jgi:hypothetical protein
MASRRSTIVNLHHGHRNFTVDDIRKFATCDLQSQRNPLVQNSHRADLLAEMVKKFITVNFADSTYQYNTPPQYDAVKRYNANSYRQGIFNLTAQRYSESEVLHAYMKLFDDLFFFSSLGDKLKLRFDVPRRAGVSQTLIGATIPGNGEATIEIYKHKHPIFGRRARMTYFLSILLHEMCHALFCVYACKHEGCYQSSDSCSVSKHGVPWQRAAFAVQFGCSHLLKLSLNLGGESLRND